MPNQTKMRHHAGLFGRMSEVIGADLPAAVRSGQLTAADYEQAVVRCTGCSGTSSCEKWLETEPSAAEAPDYCRNADLLAALRP
jgi:hypothetical protein